MRIIITGATGFVGISIVQYLREYFDNVELIGVDNLSRRGSEYNLERLKKFDCRFCHGDIRTKEDIDDLPKANWIIDCAAIPTVTAGVSSGTVALINNNFTGTVHLLEKCRKDNAGFIILSTSRVYNIDQLNQLPLLENENRFSVDLNASFPVGFSPNGIAENFSTSAPVSLYGATKIASEVLALEYHYAFGFPVWINRCGVIAGPGQFGKIDQGIISFWIYQYLLDKPLSFIGFGGKGKQVRDFIHPYDIFRLMALQIQNPTAIVPRTINVGGGNTVSLSLAELDFFCRDHLGISKTINSISETRGFDIPFYITDYSKATEYWNWKPTISKEETLRQIIEYGRNNIQILKSIT